jgi:DNA repair protein RecO (recombination protein O)
MLHQTEGVVLRCRSYGESHKILTLITPRGKLSLLARGARKPKSRLAGAAQPLVQGMFVYDHNGKTGSMGTLRHAEVIHHFYRALETSLHLQAYAMYFLEITDKLGDSESASEALYPFLLHALKLLEAGTDPQVLKIMVDLKVLAAAGYRPVWERCVHCGRQDGPFLASVRHGGLLCADCRRLDGQALVVPESGVKLLRLFQDVPLARLGQVRVREETKGLLSRLTRMFVDEYLDLPLKSAVFLDQIGQWEGV